MAHAEQPQESATPSLFFDVLAFALGIGVAAHSGWDTTTLVWSLWLSSLVVGYATIVTTTVRGGMSAAHRAKSGGGSAITLVGGVLGALFLLAFFTVHFGGFHLVHSVFLFLFFPVGGAALDESGFPGVAEYVEVVKQAGFFLPAAILAERTKIFPPKVAEDAAAVLGDGMIAPYKNVIRLHLLIFFFAFANIAKLDGLLVYSAVYALYFFPFRAVFPKPRASSA